MATKSAKNQKNKVSPKNNSIKTKSREGSTGSQNTSKTDEGNLQAQLIHIDRIFAGASFLIEKRAREQAEKIVECSKPDRLLFDLSDIIMEASMKENPTRKDRAILHLAQFCERSINLAEREAARKHEKNMSKINRKTKNDKEGSLLHLHRLHKFSSQEIAKA